MSDRPQQPLVYSCSGCSSAAQLANAAALKLDRADFDPVQARRVFRTVAQQIARTDSVGGGRVSALARPRIAEGACP